MDLDRRQFAGALIATLFLRKGWQNAAELPECPPGFTWVRSDGLQAYVPRPNGWYLHDLTDGADSSTTYVTPEPLVGTPKFSTSFVVNAMLNLPGDITTWCKAIVFACLEGHRPIEIFDYSSGDYHTCGFEKEMPATEHVPLSRIRVVGVGNKHTNSLYLVQFESPADNWDATSKIREQLFELFKVNPAV